MRENELKQEFRQMVKEFDGQRTANNIAGSVCEMYALKFHDRMMERFIINYLDVVNNGNQPKPKFKDGGK